MKLNQTKRNVRPIHLIETEYLNMVLCSGISTDDFKGITTKTKSKVTCKNCLKGIKQSPSNPFQLNG